MVDGLPEAGQSDTSLEEDGGEADVSDLNGHEQVSLGRKNSRAAAWLTFEIENAELSESLALEYGYLISEYTLR